MTLQRLTRISLLAAICVALRQAFATFPNVQPISCDDDHHVCLRLFPGDEPDCVLSDCRLWLLDAPLAYLLQVVALCPSDPFCGPTVLCLWGLDR